MERQWVKYVTILSSIGINFLVERYSQSINLIIFLHSKEPGCSHQYNKRYNQRLYHPDNALPIIIRKIKTRQWRYGSKTKHKWNNLANIQSLRTKGYISWLINVVFRHDRFSRNILWNLWLIQAHIIKLPTKIINQLRLNSSRINRHLPIRYGKETHDDDLRSEL